MTLISQGNSVKYIEIINWEIVLCQFENELKYMNVSWAGWSSILSNHPSYHSKYTKFNNVRVHRDPRPFSNITWLQLKPIQVKDQTWTGDSLLSGRSLFLSDYPNNKQVSRDFFRESKVWRNGMSWEMPARHLSLGESVSIHPIVQSTTPFNPILQGLERERERKHHGIGNENSLILLLSPSTHSLILTFFPPFTKSQMWFISSHRYSYSSHFLLLKRQSSKLEMKWNKKPSLNPDLTFLIVYHFQNWRKLTRTVRLGVWLEWREDTPLEIV